MNCKPKRVYFFIKNYKKLLTKQKYKSKIKLKVTKGG